MGRQVAAAVAAAPDLEPVAFADALATVDEYDGLPLYRDVVLCLDETKPDVIVDFTNAAWTPVLAEAAVPRGIRLVIGTSGLPPEFLDWLAEETRGAKLGAVVAPNFAIGAVLMMHFARQAARFFDNVEIIELHHGGKVDAPSGTAKATAELMVESRGEDFVNPVAELQTVPGTRGGSVGGVTIHSVRLPGLVAHQEILFGGLGQTLSLRHDSTGRDSFMPGVLAAVRAVMSTDHLVVGLDELLGLT